MAAPPALESIPGTPTPTTITPPDTGFEHELRELKLNNEWMIGERIVKGNGRHSAVYSVLISETGQLAEDLEAHVFPLRDIEPKLRKYRQRCIKRMKGRIEMKVQFKNVTIVVITTSKTESASDLAHGGEPHSMGKDERHETDTRTTQIRDFKQHVQELFQLESQRTQQREKQQAKRSANTEQGDEKADFGGHSAQKIDKDMWPDENNEFPMFTSLVHDLLDGWDWWEISAMYISLAENEANSCLHEVYNQYLLQTAAALRKLDELKTYLMVKQREIITLRTQRSSREQAKQYQRQGRFRLVEMRRT